MDRDLLRRLNAARAARRAVLLLTNLDDGEDRLIFPGDATPAPLGPLIDEAFRSGRSGLVEGQGSRLFLNVHLPVPRIAIIGAVHISQALAQMAALAGFAVTVIDPRTAFASTERFGCVDLIAEWPEEALLMRPLDPYTALVALAHDPKIDDDPLVQALDAGCFYVGALGSRKTHARRVERMLAKGLDPARIAHISAPVGLDIGAVSPPEIAVAILAEIIAALRGRSPSEAGR